jgi:hypothetical protein
LGACAARSRIRDPVGTAEPRASFVRAGGRKLAGGCDDRSDIARAEDNDRGSAPNSFGVVVAFGRGGKSDRGDSARSRAECFATRAETRIERRDRAVGDTAAGASRAHSDASGERRPARRRAAESADTADTADTASRDDDSRFVAACRDPATRPHVRPGC